MEVPQGVDPSFWAFCSWMHNHCLHHLRTLSLLFHSLSQAASHTYCPHLFHLFNTAIYSLNVKTQDEEISDGLVHTNHSPHCKVMHLPGINRQKGHTHHTLIIAAVGLEIKRLFFTKPLSKLF